MVTDYDPINLLFGGMEKLGPGDEAHTLRALGLLPQKDFNLVVDVGCGSGRQTMALAKALGTLVHAVDLLEPFLEDLNRIAQEAGLGHLIQTHCLDMRDIAETFQDIDLLWSEGSAYNIGFGNALASWASSLRPGGFLVVSELSWIKEQVPEQVKAFFDSEYPDLQSAHRNTEVIENAGYKVLDTHTLPRESWVEGYYSILGPRAQALRDHEDASVRAFAEGMITEIDIFEKSEDSYGYIMFVLQRA